VRHCDCGDVHESLTHVDAIQDVPEGPCRSPDSTRGSMSIEAMLLIPLFLLAIFATLEASLWVHASTVAQAAAQDGVRAATVLGGDENQAREESQRILDSHATGEDWAVATSSDATTLTVTVTGNALSVIPGVAFPVRESASLPWEGR